MWLESNSHRPKRKESDMRLKDKIAIVTGGGQGIGEGIAKKLAAAGAKVAIITRTTDKSIQVANRIKENGGEAVALSADVTNYQSAKKAIDAVLEAWGSIDILVNNVGGDIMKPFIETDEAIWDQQIALNYKSFLNCIHICAPHMIEKKSGKIISISSESARAGQMNECLYCGAKGAIIASTKGLAREFARYNINVNCISPGITDTPLIQELRKSERGEQIISKTTKTIPLKRIGDPEEIGDLAVFFASDESKYITGQVLSINGGQQMIG